MRFTDFMGFRYMGLWYLNAFLSPGLILTAIFRPISYFVFLFFFSFSYANWIHNSCATPFPSLTPRLLPFVWLLYSYRDAIHAGCSYARLITLANSVEGEKRSVPSTTKHTEKKEKLTIKPDILLHHRPLGLIFLIHRHHNNPPRAIHAPPADLLDEMLKLRALQPQPAFEHPSLHLAAALPHRHGDAHAHQLFEAAHVGDQVRVQVVAVQRGPELRVLGRREEGVEVSELLHGFGEGGVAGGGV